jgi:hypothetical protein
VLRMESPPFQLTQIIAVRPRMHRVPFATRQHAAFSHECGLPADYINHKNELFNTKIEKAYSKYTQEIKANLERGTALPDR